LVKWEYISELYLGNVPQRLIMLVSKVIVITTVMTSD
jgi:hypothetical protein